MKATIWMNEGPGRFFRFAPGDTLREAYEVDVEPTGEMDATWSDRVLEVVFRAANRVDGSPIEQVPDGERSLSVGDVVQFGEVAYACEMVGFREVGPDEFLTAVFGA